MTIHLLLWLHSQPPQYVALSLYNKSIVYGGNRNATMFYQLIIDTQQYKT